MQGRFTKEEKTKKIHISELQIGMWVSKLDRDWLDTPFLMQGFLIESVADIDTVAEFSEYVWIDAKEENWSQHTSNKTITAKPAAKSYINKVDARTENRRVLGVYRDARRLTKSMLDEARLSSVINAEQAEQTVQQCVDSVIRNPDALVWLSKIRSQDEYTSEHCLNVCILAIAFGRQLGYDQAQLTNLGVCGLLHDVGKMKVPPEVLNKPGELNEQELNIMRSHTTLGRNMLLTSGSGVAQAVDVAWNHHEQLNGSGYPRGLNDASINRITRIISIVDAFDAMTADRCYKKAMSSTRALKIIYDNRGKCFDKELSEQFLRTVGLYPPGSVVELGNGYVGLVIESNQQYRQLPKIAILLNPKRQAIKEKIVDLALIEQGKLNKNFLIKAVYVDGTFGIRVRDYQQRGMAFGTKSG